MSRKRRTPSQGLGDTIEKITVATGIKAAVKFIAGEDCGCDKRKEKLNKLFPYKKALCLTEDEYNFLQEALKPKRDWKPSEQKRMWEIHDRVFHIKRRENTSCADCVRQMAATLKKLMETYEENNTI